MTVTGEATHSGEPHARGYDALMVGYAIVTVVAIGLRLYKAHATGIVHDEAITWQLFCQTYSDALTLYPFSNNHVINSLLICLVRPLAMVWDHFIRLPSLVFAAMFIAASWRLCRGTIVSGPLGLACHAAVVLSWYPLDLSFQARGYGGVMACNMALLCMLAEIAAGDYGGDCRH